MKKTAAATVLLIAIGACTVGPDYERPEVEVNESWLEARDPRIKTGEERRIEWWEAFEDPVLDELIRRAHRQNLSLRIAGVRVLQSMAQRGISVGQLFPQFQELGADYTRTRASENTPGAGAYSSSWGIGFDAAWELDLWGRFRRAIEASDADLDASLANYDTVMVSLLSEVALAYVQIRTLQSRIRIAEGNAEVQEGGVSLAEARFQLGSTSELDTTHDPMTTPRSEDGGLPGSCPGCPACDSGACSAVRDRAMNIGPPLGCECTRRKPHRSGDHGVSGTPPDRWW